MNHDVSATLLVPILLDELSLFFGKQLVSSFGLIFARFVIAHTKWGLVRDFEFCKKNLS